MKARSTHRTALCAALFAAILMAAAGGASAAAPASETRHLWKKADAFAANRLYIDAVNAYSQVIRLNRGEISMDEMAAVFSGRGLAYEGQKNTTRLSRTSATRSGSMKRTLNTT